jgi:DNA repair photolyase
MCRAAREAGLNVYVAVAPTYPECDEADLHATLRAVAEIKPVTIFHEPINIPAENVERIEAHARALGLVSLSSSNAVPRPRERERVVEDRVRVVGKNHFQAERAGERSRNLVLRTDVFESRERWQDYAVNALQTVERLAAEAGIADRLHLWPDKSLGNLGVANRMPKPREYLRWLRKSW